MKRLVFCLAPLLLVGCGDRSDSPDAVASGAPLVGSGTFIVNCMAASDSGNSTTIVNVDCGDRNQEVIPPPAAPAKPSAGTE
jgi:hypothetical protein